MYLRNIRQISTKQLKENGITNPQEVKDLINADICWMVTDNIRSLLSLGEPVSHVFLPSDKDRFIDVCKKAIQNHQLMIFFQDEGVPDRSGGQDHWFSVIGSNNGVLTYVFEHLPTQCNSMTVFDSQNYVHYLSNILIGKEPDRFYGQSIPHFFKVYIHDRRALNAQTVVNYLK